MPIQNSENWMPFGVFAGQTVTVHPSDEPEKEIDPLNDGETHVTFHRESYMSSSLKRQVAFVHFAAFGIHNFEKTMSKELYVTIPGKDFNDADFEFFDVESLPKNTSHLIYIDSPKALHDVMLAFGDLVSWANARRTTIIFVFAINIRKLILLNLQYRPNVYCYFIHKDQPSIFKGIGWIAT